MHIAEDTSAPSNPLPRVATFFAIYPEPLGLTDGTYFCAHEETPVSGFSTRIALHLNGSQDPVWLDPQFSNSLVVSIRFHRGQLEQNIVAAHYGQLMTIVRGVGGSNFPNFGNDMSSSEAMEDALGGIEDFSISSYTVVEMTTQLVIPHDGELRACTFRHDVMGPTLTRCIDALMKIVTAYRFAEKILIPSPARERLGPAIVAATRPADPADGGWDAPAYDVINTFAVAGQPALRGGDGPNTLARVAKFLDYEAAGHPVLPLAHLQADMDSAFYHEGNFRAAILFAHSSSEVLLDIALTAMSFEEHLPLEDVLRSFDKPLKTRLLTEYHERLGGRWLPTGNGAVANWMSRVLRVRHLVAHGGYSPSYQEALLAREAHFSIGTHLRDRLAQKVKQYPFAAGILVTQDGFNRRNIHSRAAKEAVRAADSPVLQEFLDWRARVMQRRL
jgi:hypothetical protein